MKLLLHKIKRHKARYLSIILSLVVIQGILFFSINILGNFKAALFPEINFNTEQLYQLQVFFPYPNTKPEIVNMRFNADILEKLKSIEDIESCCVGFGNSLFMKKIQSYSLKTNLDSTLKIFVSSGGYGMENIIPLELLKGSFYTTPDPLKKEVILTETLARKLNLFDKPLPRTVSLPTNWADAKWSDFSLCGIVKDMEFYNSKDHTEAVFPLIFKSFSNSSVLIKLKPKTNLAEIENKIKQTILPYVNEESPIIEIMEFRSFIMDDWERSKSQMIPLISIIPLVLFYSLFALFGLFWNDMKHKKVDFGIMRAIGFSRFSILWILIREAIFLVIAASIFSLILLLNFKTSLNEYIDTMEGSVGFWTSWSVGILLVLMLVITAAIIPAVKTMYINPVEALADE